MYTSPAEGVFTTTLLGCGCLVLLCMNGTLIVLDCPEHSGLKARLESSEQCLQQSL